MNETEQLKESADQQKALNQLEIISRYLDEIIEELDEAMYWVRRSGRLVDFVLISYLVAVVFTLLMDSSLVIRTLAPSWIFFIFLVTVFRSIHFRFKFSKAIGEFNGASEILAILGIIAPPQKPGIRKRRSVWKDGVALVKSWVVKKKKMQKEVYGHA